MCASSVVVLYVVLGGVLQKASARDGAYKDMVIFSDVLKRVQDEYVERPDIAKLTSGAIRGLAFGVDSFSAYLTPEEYAFIKSRKQVKAETGIILSPRVGYFRAMAVLPGSPADEAGIVPGDVLEEIDGKGVSEHGLPYVHALLSGDTGSPVKIGVVRGQDEELIEFTIKRRELPTVPVEARILEPGVGLVQVRDLHAKSPDELKRAMNTLASGEVKKVVLDLRDCATGTYDAALAAASCFVGSGTLAVKKTRGAADVTYPAMGPKAVFQGPVVVLFNGFTLGPAELLAAALGETGRAKLVGIKTYGAAAEQRFIEMEDGSALYLTVARYYSPKGRCLTNEKYPLSGVRPDLKSPPEDFSLSSYIDYELAVGPESVELYRKYMEDVRKKQMEQALELLKTGVIELQPAA